MIFGYGVNLDTARIRMGLALQDRGAAATRFAAALAQLAASSSSSADIAPALDAGLMAGDIRGIVVILLGLRRAPRAAAAAARIEVITDGARAQHGELRRRLRRGRAGELGGRARRAAGRGAPAPPIEVVRPLTGSTPRLISRNFIVPGSMAIIMTIIGALLTSLVIAREWERGTMEALLSTPVTPAGVLLSKMLPYYVLGMLGSALMCLMLGDHACSACRSAARSLLLVLYTSLFLGSSLGLGLLLSTLTRNQFNAAQAALNAAFLPALMLSGWVYEISSMPAPVRAVTYLIPARYFINALQTLFQAGFIGRILLQDRRFSWLGLDDFFLRTHRAQHAAAAGLTPCRDASSRSSARSCSSRFATRRAAAC